MAEDRGLVPRARVDDLAALGEREGDVPVGDGELALLAVGDVGIGADRVPRRDGLAELVDADPDLRAVDEAGEPGRLGLQ